MRPERTYEVTGRDPQLSLRRFALTVVFVKRDAHRPKMEEQEVCYVGTGSYSVETVSLFLPCPIYRPSYSCHLLMLPICLSTSFTCPVCPERDFA